LPVAVMQNDLVQTALSPSKRKRNEQRHGQTQKIGKQNQPGPQTLSLRFTWRNLRRGIE